MEEFQCGICNNRNSSLASCVDHVYTHRSSQNSCVVSGCHRVPARLTRHLKGSHRNLCEYPCGTCKKPFVREFDLKQHSNALHGGIVSHQHHVHSSTSRGETSSQSGRGFLEAFGLSQHSNAHLHGAFASRQHHSNAEIDFRSSTTASDLNKFIDDHLQPTTEFNNEMNQTVDQICTFLRKHFSPREIIKGGSLGKGTAVKGKSDIDLVLVLNEVTDAADLRENLLRIKKNIKDKLRMQSHNFSIVGDISESQFAVKFTVEGINGNIDVDLLPTFHFDDLKRLYYEMKDDKSNWEYYSASLVKYQVDFVEDYPANLKNLIRLVKYWKKEKIRDTASRVPNSYVMELITIHLWEEHTGDDGRFDTLKAFHGVMTALKDYKSLHAIWNENYDTNEIPKNVRRAQKPRKGKPKRPLVMDPANPTNNVCSRFEWDEIETAAMNVLSSPMLRGVTSHTWK